MTTSFIGLSPEEVAFCNNHCRVCGGSGLEVDTLNSTGEHIEFKTCSRCHGMGGI